MGDIEGGADGIGTNKLLLVRMTCMFNTLPVRGGRRCDDEATRFG